MKMLSDLAFLDTVNFFSKLFILLRFSSPFLSACLCDVFVVFQVFCFMVVDLNSVGSIPELRLALTTYM